MRRVAIGLAGACAIGTLALTLGAEPAWAAGRKPPLRQVRVERPGALHVPSPDWREQVIYFVMTDRFADGDPFNNDQGAGEYDPRRASHYSGGDLRGLRRKLGYIQGLGATALWITPPVANQWVEGLGGHTGYHGYWAEHFRRVDRHLGTLADLQALARALHGRGMFLVQDIVVNHTGNFFDYAGGWDAQDPARFYRLNPASRPVQRPSQPPFDLNDPRRARDRRAGIYHWTPAVSDYGDPVQEADFQMSGLDDLNTGNPAVRRALRQSYGWWIRQAGVDAFRVDTAFYVPPAHLRDLLHAKDARAPGILEVARRTGRRDFLVFGEGFGIDKPFTDEQARKIERYVRDERGRPVLGGMLNFPLYGALADVLARGQPTAQLAHRIEALALHARPHLMPSFVDNHDVDRFLAGGSRAALGQALLAIFTLPGIPVVYYGTEQGFTLPRASMFAAGFGSGGRDRFDTSAPLYRTLAELSALRRGDAVFTRGQPQVLAHSAAAAGALAWRMAAPGRPSAFVVLNTADHEVLLDRLPTALPPGTRLRGRFGLEGKPADLRTGADGSLTLVLPPRAAWVWQAEERAPGTPPAPPAADSGHTAPSIDPLPAVITGDTALSGQAAAGRPLRLVIDGDLSRARTVLPDAAGRWQAQLDTATMFDPETPHRLVVWDASSGAVSPRVSFKVQRSWQPLVDIEDPAGDDSGPDGRYRYPSDASFAVQRTLDLRRVRVFGSAGALRIDLEMAGLAQSWNPPNGFDHLALTVFLEWPRSTEAGVREMPLQHAQLPEGMRWHRRLRVHGWSNALFGPAGASATQEGTPVVPGARVSVDRAARTISLLLPAAALGDVPSLSGARLYVTTWDYDAGYRGLEPVAQPYAFGGGDATGPRVMDASPVIVLP